MQADREGKPSLGSRTTRGESPFHKLRALLSPKTPPPSVTEDHLLCFLAFRRGREAALGRELFSDPAWDVLLELLAAELGGRKLTVQQLARLIDVPRSTVSRWIDALADRGLVTPVADRSDSQLWIVLSERGHSEMKRLLDHWCAAFGTTWTS